MRLLNTLPCSYVWYHVYIVCAVKNLVVRDSGIYKQKESFSFNVSEFNFN